MKVLPFRHLGLQGKRIFFFFRIFAAPNYKKAESVMENTVKKNEKKRKPLAKPKQKRKSKYTIWREKYPNGIVTILDLEAVLQ
jgi:hypothetical protein